MVKKILKESYFKRMSFKQESIKNAAINFRKPFPQIKTDFNQNLTLPDL